MHRMARGALETIGDISEFLMEERPEKMTKAMQTLVSLDNVLNIPYIHSWLETYAYDNEKTIKQRKIGQVDSKNIIEYATELGKTVLLDEDTHRYLRQLHLMW